MPYKQEREIQKEGVEQFKIFNDVILQKLWISDLEYNLIIDNTLVNIYIDDLLKTSYPKVYTLIGLDVM